MLCVDMRSSVPVPSTVVNQFAKLWTVDWNPGDATFEPTGATSFQVFARSQFRCAHRDRPEVVYVVDAVETFSMDTTAPGSGRQSPWSLDSIERITIEARTGDWAQLFRQARLSSLARAIEADRRIWSILNPEAFAPSKLLPKPGRAGYPELHYAQWASRYVDATTTYGHGYMKRLLEEHPGETRSNILRKIARAEKLGLIERYNEPGKVGRAILTDKAHRLLEEGVTP